MDSLSIDLRIDLCAVRRALPYLLKQAVRAGARERATSLIDRLGLRYVSLVGRAHDEAMGGTATRLHV